MNSQMRIPDDFSSLPDLMLLNQIHITRDFCLYLRPGDKILRDTPYVTLLDAQDARNQKRYFCRYGDQWVRIQPTTTAAQKGKGIEIFPSFYPSDSELEILNGSEVSDLMKWHEESVKEWGYIRPIGVTFSNKFVRACRYTQPDKLIPMDPPHLIVTLLYRYERNSEKFFCQENGVWIRIQPITYSMPTHPHYKIKKKNITELEKKHTPTPEELVILSGNQVVALYIKSLLDLHASLSLAEQEKMLGAFFENMRSGILKACQAISSEPPVGRRAGKKIKRQDKTIEAGSETVKKSRSVKKQNPDNNSKLLSSFSVLHTPEAKSVSVSHPPEESAPPEEAAPVYLSETGNGFLSNLWSEAVGSLSGEQDETLCRLTL